MMLNTGRLPKQQEAERKVEDHVTQRTSHPSRRGPILWLPPTNNREKATGTQDFNPRVLSDSRQHPLFPNMVYCKNLMLFIYPGTFSMCTVELNFYVHNCKTYM